MSGSLVKPNRRGLASREVVLDAAERVMSEHGFEGATIARIVAEAQVPLSSVYHYFGSKDGVLVNVVERGAHRLFAAMASHPLPEGTRIEKLTAFARALETELEKAPAFLGLMLSVAITPGAFSGSGTQEVVREARERSYAAIRDGLSRIFELAPTCDINVQLTRYVLASIDGAVFARKADDVAVASILGHLPAAVIGIHASIVSASPEPPDRTPCSESRAADPA